MESGAFAKLVALAISALVALSASWLLSRHDRRARPPRALLAGYPRSQFPHAERIAGPLASLCESQSSLLQLYRGLPPDSLVRPGLLVFLGELRALMDGAYQLAALDATGPVQLSLEQLARGARAAVAELMARAQAQLGDTQGSELSTELEVRLEVLRALAHDLGDSRAPR